MTRKVAVIGAGVVGLATAWALDARGIDCRIFEPAAPGGSQSAGESRVFRHAHADPRQTALAVEARAGWRRWEEEFDCELITRDGAMVIGEESLARLRTYAGTPGARVRDLSPAEVRSVLPVLAEYEGPALIDEAAGSIRTGLTLANLIAAVSPNLVPERVDSVTPRPGGGVDIQSTSGVQVFDAAVITVGAGTLALAAKAGAEIPLSARACLRLTLPLADPGPASQLACLHDSSGFFAPAVAYASPVDGNREYAVGLALRPDIAGSGGPEFKALAAATLDYVKRAMPGLDPAGAVAIERRVAELPWGADGLAIWQSGDAFFVAGNNLFKLAPVLAEKIARSVIAGTVEPGLKPEDRLGEPALEPH